MPKFKRRRLWVDPQVQGAFLWRTLLYWVASVSVVALLQFIWRTIAIALGQLPDDDATIWSYAGPAIATIRR